jgi:hypothetical protein
MTVALRAVPSRIRQRGLLTGLVSALIVLVAASSLIGLLTSGGPGRQLVQTARGATVTLYAEGLYAADTWLIGAGKGVAQLVSGVPLTAGEIVTKIVTFAALTLIASGLLARMAQVGAKNAT